ncbi:aldo/keto reductase [Garicola koreensis]|uniref:Aryl-alcohol dehydrogenase-like predicted oxidoreductase n=1 Tax=Garicola koreensis TaxID=1262554 RepID=A0A7W5TP13_9MICC|nr:aldo/keto reductase [Garicola koreensis]MBB3667001.1 aryl-alcohol dehydrogenase-like predicted oxidoreductase [Garicola koreensis]
MQHRTFGPTGRRVSSIGLGTWQLGTEWGDVAEADALAVLDAAVESGVTLFDTADVYGDGRSEQLIGRWLAKNPTWGGTVATKMIRRAPEPTLEHATAANFRAWTDRSRANLGVDTLDLVQLHCPTDDVYGSDLVFDTLDSLVEDATITAYGVSVETCEQALRAIARPNVASVQIVLNAFRQKPLEEVIPAARQAGTAIIARVPLASGLLTGRYTKETTFADTDHRSFNRHGEAFDIGETFAGVDFETGVDAAAEFSELARDFRLKPSAAALAWAVQQPGVSTVIPGARSPEQARGNAAAAETDPLPAEFMAAVQELYGRRIRPLVHHKW